MELANYFAPKEGFSDNNRTQGGYLTDLPLPLSGSFLTALASGVFSNPNQDLEDMEDSDTEEEDEKNTGLINSAFKRAKALVHNYNKAAESVYSNKGAERKAKAKRRYRSAL